MMGAAVANLDAPVTKGTTGVVVLHDDDARYAASRASPASAAATASTPAPSS